MYSRYRVCPDVPIPEEDTVTLTDVKLATKGGKRAKAAIKDIANVRL
jgi:hypothetical protein